MKVLSTIKSAFAFELADDMQVVATLTRLEASEEVYSMFGGLVLQSASSSTCFIPALKTTGPQTHFTAW